MSLYWGKLGGSGGGGGNINTKFREAFESYTPGERWAQVQASGDIIALDGNSAAASYLVLSLNPLGAGTVSTLETIGTFSAPLDLAVGIHTSQRTLGQEFSVEVVSDEPPLPTPADVAISSVSQAASVLTVTTATVHNLRPGMSIGIRDCVDSRMNYPALVVATTPSTTQFTVTAGPGGTIPSVTAGPFTSGFVFQRSRLGFAPNGTSMVLENATATNASFYVRSESGDVLPSGTIVGNHSVTTLTTASVQAINTAGAYAFQPTNEFRLSQFVNGVQWSDVGVDAVAATNNRYKRTQVAPDVTVPYQLRFRATNNASLTRPVAQIVTAVKTGTTTATITTDVAHGLTTADQIVIYGIRAQGAAEFPNLLTATAVASVVNATTFTVVIGTAGTITSYGGYVARVNGGNLMSALGANAVVAQSVVRTANVLTVTGNASWAGLLIGDYVNLVGCRNNTDGATLGIDGAYRVRSINAALLELEPLPGTPMGTDILSTNCGGAIIRRTCLRISFARVLDFERQRVELMPRPSGDVAESVPVAINGLPPVTIASGTVTTVSALTGGGAAEDAAAGANPVVTGGVVRTARAPATLVAGDAARHTITTEGSMTVQPGPVVPIIEVGSAARTTTGNSGLISVATGGGLSGLISVTAVSGTPTLDITLEETYDNGTTWTQVWAAPRITGISTLVIPPMLTGGLRRWGWTIGGGTPSLTFAITVNAVPSPCPIIRQSFDRTAALLSGTLNATSASIIVAGCKAITAKVSLGAATTPGTYQIQLSDDSAAWSNVGTATVGIASGVLTLIAPVGVTANFARVICTSAATGQTGNYVAINAVS